MANVFIITLAHTNVVILHLLFVILWKIIISKLRRKRIIARLLKFRLSKLNNIRPISENELSIKMAPDWTFSYNSINIDLYTSSNTDTDYRPPELYPLRSYALYTSF